MDQRKRIESALRSLITAYDELGKPLQDLCTALGYDCDSIMVVSKRQDTEKAHAPADLGSAEWPVFTIIAMADLQNDPMYFTRLERLLEAHLTRRELSKVIGKLEDLGIIRGEWTEGGDGRWYRYYHAPYPQIEDGRIEGYRDHPWVLDAMDMMAEGE